MLISDLRFFFFGVCAFSKIILQRNFGFSVRLRVPTHTGSCMEFTLVTRKVTSISRGNFHAGKKKNDSTFDRHRVVLL